jgi:hypothetical protein
MSEITGELAVLLLCTGQGNCITVVHSAANSVTEIGKRSTSEYFHILLYCWLLLMFIFTHFL